MRFRFAVAGLMLGSLTLSGCGEGEKIPPTKGGAEARNAVEYPLGPPPASKSAKAKKAAAANALKPASPDGVH